jgi:hypothetical protein
MRSTRSARTNKRGTLRVPRNAVTMSQLNNWFKATYEKMGWMVLSKAKGMGHKVVEYKKSLKHLVASIEQVMHEYTDMNRIHDLKVLHMEACVLRDFASKHL